MRYEYSDYQSADGNGAGSSGLFSVSHAWSKGVHKAQAWKQGWSYKYGRSEEYEPWDVQVDEKVASSLHRIGFCDAHCHLDYVIHNKVHGWGWMNQLRTCAWWKEYGYCDWGDDCQFAHGEDMKRRRIPLTSADVDALRKHHPPFMQSDASEVGMKKCGVRCLINNCCEVEAIEDTLMLLQQGTQGLPGVVRFAVGCHPHYYTEYDDNYEAQLLRVADQCGDRLVAWGECGLDYYKNHSYLKQPEHREHMLWVFARQAQISVQRRLPLVIHTREADEDTWQVMKENLPKNHLIHIHAYQGSGRFMRRVLRWFPQSVFGISGLVLFPNPSQEAIDAAKDCPLDRMVLETDAPFLSTEPRAIPAIAVKIAQLRGVTPEEVLQTTNRNCLRFYGIE